jgi:hypothetical protein
MSERFTETCPVCSVRKDPEVGQFLFASGDLPSAEKVYDRVCVYARNNGREGCINTTIGNGSEGWLDFQTPDSMES